MATVALTQDNFDQVVNGNDMVLIDFWAPWCGPCRGFAPVFEAASEKHGDIVFEKVNLFSQAGALPGSALEQVITQGKALDMAAVHKEIAERDAGAQKQA